MRCPDCNKFVGYDEPQCEIGSVEINSESRVVTGDVRIVLCCAECSGELKEANLDFETDIEEHKCKKKGKAEDAFEENESSAEPHDRFQDKDRHGKPIKNSRYMKHYYGAVVSGSVMCSHCEEVIPFNEETVEEQASGFDELV